MSMLLAYAAAAAAAAIALPKLKARAELSLAKHPSLAGHARMARRFAAQVPHYEYDDALIFAIDGAADDVVVRRMRAFRALAALYASRYPATLQRTREVQDSLSDLQFTSHYRVPFQFSRYVRTHLKSGAFVASSDGVTVTDLDGNRMFDVAGSYGVNLFGLDFYKTAIRAAETTARELGPLLGAYHPLVADNVHRLRRISGLDEVSFHMSGTEAVMQAVRLARYHTRRTHLVRFCGAYHGWWGDVQPGVGNPVTARETYTLKEMDEATLRVLRSRNDIACVLVNPLQALHPNQNAPGDSTLIDSSRKAGFDRAAYTAWLQQLRAVCSARGIVLILDEVFTGFRLAPGGAQEYFGVHADLVTYGKSLGGGLPIGVVCGRHDLMQRFRPERPADISFARGTFNSHPYVMAAMHEFLKHLEVPETRACYATLDATWDARARRFNQRLADAGLPVRAAHLSSIWTILYDRPGRYNWMLQYYLRAHGLMLSWVGTGRLIFSLNYTDADFDIVTDRFVDAARAMQDDGWWDGPLTLTNQDIRRQVLMEMVQARLRALLPGKRTTPTPGKLATGTARQG